MKCAEIMKLDPKVCVPEDSVITAVDLMWDHDCGAVPVVKDLESKELVGIVTDRDIAMHVVKHCRVHPSQAKVGHCMSSPVVTCLPDAPLEEAIQLMGEHRVRRIPIVDENGGCVGALSQADLILGIDDPELVVGALRKISAPREKVAVESEESEVKVEATEKASAVS